MDDEERQLIRRVLAGETAAFMALHEGNAGRVTAYLLRSGFRPADADDLTQEVFLRAFKSLGTFDPRRGAFRDWLGAIARNVARRHWRRRAEAESFDPRLAEEMFAAPPDPDGGPEQREERQAVRECVDALPAELARVVRLRYVDGRTTRGIAAATGLPEATVRLRLTEAMDILQRRLKEKGFLE